MRLDGDAANAAGDGRWLGIEAQLYVSFNTLRTHTRVISDGIGGARPSGGSIGQRGRVDELVGALRGGDGPDVPFAAGEFTRGERRSP